MKNIRVRPSRGFSETDPLGALQTLGIQVVLCNSPFCELNASALGANLTFQEYVLRQAQGARPERRIESLHPVEALTTDCHVRSDQSMTFVVWAHLCEHCSMHRLHPPAKQMRGQPYLSNHGFSLPGSKWTK
jgi:hypothetical protein